MAQRAKAESSAMDFRIHPVIGIAQVGNSKEYVSIPETMAGSPQAGSHVTGGLPIKASSESEAVWSSGLNDSHGAVKRHIAIF